MLATESERQAVSLRELVRPTQRQQEFLDAMLRYRFLLYGGAAGGGKSYILRWGLVVRLMYWAAQGHRGVVAGMFCEDYPALKDRQLSKIQQEFPPWLGTYHEDHRAYGRAFVLRPEWGGGVIAFRNLDDPSKYHSAEFAAIAVDELTKNSYDTFNMLRFRLRWPGIEDTTFLAATNPGGPGHGWVKQLWIERNFPAELAALAHQFYYVPARAEDNPHLPRQYYEDLATLPPELRRAYLEGDWDIFAGQAFTEFRWDIHTVEPFAIPAEWPRYRAGDWGYGAPYCILWGAVSPEGITYIYRELYGWGGKPNVGSRETVSQVREKIREIERRAGEAWGLPTEPIWRAVLDPECWSRRGHTGPSIAEEFMAGGVYWTPADNDRKQGKMRVHEALRLDENGRPLLYIFRDRCPHLLRTLPALPVDPNDPEDVDTEAEDHAYDALRYLLMARPRPGRPKAQPEPNTMEARIERKLEELFSNRKRTCDEADLVGRVR